MNSNYLASRHSDAWRSSCILSWMEEIVLKILYQLIVRVYIVLTVLRVDQLLFWCTLSWTGRGCSFLAMLYRLLGCDLSWTGRGCSNNAVSVVVLTMVVLIVEVYIVLNWGVLTMLRHRAYYDSDATWLDVAPDLIWNRLFSVYWYYSTLQTRCFYTSLLFIWYWLIIIIIMFMTQLVTHPDLGKPLIESRIIVSLNSKI